MAILEPILYKLSEYKSVIGDGRSIAGVHVGGKDLRPLPIVNFSKHDDRAWLALNHEASVITTQKEDFIDNAFILICPETTHKIWQLDDKVIEWRFEFKERPKSDEIVFKISDSGNLNYCRQKTIWDEYHSQSEEFQNRFTLEWYVENCVRPDNVIGSYAVYLKEDALPDIKRFTQSRKMIHLFRWEVTDAEGKKAWCESNVADGKFTITMPKDFLDSAKFPIFAMGSGDTFGNVGTGATSINVESGVICGYRATSGAAGTVDRVSFYGGETAAPAVHYVSAALVYQSTELLAVKAPSSVNDIPMEIEWCDVDTFSGEAVEAATGYIICVGTGTGSGQLRVYYDNLGSGGVGELGTSDYGGTPVEQWWTGISLTNNNNDYSIHCDYTAGGGGTVTTETSIDSLIKKTISQTLSLDSMLQKSIPITLSIDALLNIIGQLSVSLDANIIKRFLQTTSLDANIQKLGLTSDVDLDAFLSKSGVNTVSIDAILNMLGIESSLSIDALIKKEGLTQTVSIDAIIYSLGEGIITTSLDALIKKYGVLFQTNIDALIQKASISTISMDSYLQSQESANVLIDAIISKIFTTQLSMDALLYASNTGNVILDAYMSKFSSLSISLDAIIAGFGIETWLDAIITRLGLTQTVSLDALLFEGKVLTVSLDSILQETLSYYVNMDAVMKKNSMTEITYLDAIIYSTLVTASAKWEFFVNQERESFSVNAGLGLRQSFNAGARESFRYL